MVDNGHNVMFYWFSPDPLIARVGAMPVQFKTYTPACESVRTRSPKTSGLDCAYPISLLKKMIHKRFLEADSDLNLFYTSFILRDSDVTGLLQRHKSGGGTEDAYNVSCHWIRNNYPVWSTWVRNTEQNRTTAAKLSSSGGADNTVVVIVPVVLGVVVAVVSGFVISTMFRSKLANMYAPRGDTICILFTDIEGSTKLWQQHPEAMTAALDTHHSIIRKEITDHHAYEVKTVGDAFMIACRSSLDAVLLSSAIQQSLNDSDEWPTSLQFVEGVGLGPPEVWRGLRVRMGIHAGPNVTASYDAIHQRYDYYGHDVNVSSRVQAEAVGGQVMLSAVVFEELSDLTEFSIMFPDGCLLCKEDAELKGVQGCMTLYVLPTPNLEERVFPNVTQVSEFATVSAPVNFIDTVSRRSGGGRETYAVRVLKTILALCETKDESENVLASLARGCAGEEANLFSKKRKVATVAGHLLTKLKRGHQKSLLVSGSGSRCESFSDASEDGVDILCSQVMGSSATRDEATQPPSS
eukprot:PhM_4_TR15230/c0_g1_i1/m.80933